MKNLSQANGVALLKQAIAREFPGARLLEQEHEVTVALDGVSVAVTAVEMQTKTLHEIVTGVVAVAAQKGVKSATVLAAEKLAK